MSVPGLTRPPDDGLDDEAPQPRRGLGALLGRGSRGSRKAGPRGEPKSGEPKPAWSVRGARNGRNGRDGRGADTDPQRTMAVRPHAQLAARVGLWALVALGALGGLVGLLRPSTPAVEPSDAGGSSDVTPPEVAGFGELAVITWVQAEGDGAEEALDPLYVIDPASDSGSAGKRRVNGDATAVATREVSDEYWAVTVAAPVDEYTDGAWHSVGTWYLEVGVARTDDGLVAISEPAIVPAPTEPESAPEPAGDGLGVPSQDDEDMATTVDGFLNALMAGNGDVSRYLAPGVEILPVTPPPFAEVRLQRWDVEDAGEGAVRVRLAAKATSAGGVPRTVSYELGLAERAGRWEVTSLSGAPTIEGEGDSPPATTGTTAEPSATSSPTTAEPTTTVSFASEPGA